jgi:diguanylate cyclase (GGDEF)-like protein
MHILRSARAQVAAAVVLFVLLLAAISVVAVWSAHNHQSRLQSLEQTSLAATTLEHARAQFHLETVVLTALVLTEEQSLIAEYRLAQAELHQNLEQAEALALARGDTDDLVALEEVMEQISAFEEIGEMAIPIVAAGDADMIRDLLGTYQAEAWISGEELVYGFEDAVQRKQEALASERAAAAHDADITLFTLAGLSSIVFLLALGGAAVLNNSVVRPLAALRAKARAIRAGDLEVRADVSGPEEIASLARSFNEMTEALLKRTDELQQRHQQLSLLHRAVSALSQTLGTHGVLTLGRKLISECRGSQDVAVWEVQDGEVHRWTNNPRRRPEDPDVAPSPAIIEQVKLSTSQGTPLLIPQSGNGADAEANPSGDGGGRLYLSLDRRGPARHVLEVELVKTPALTGDDIRHIYALGMEISMALERAQQYEEAQEQANRDFLTGLYGHRALQSELERALKASSRRSEPLAIVAMDVDNFRLFNDTHGHSAGDQVLKMIAEHLANLCQDGNLAGRFGGDDFMVILPKAKRNVAFDFAQSVQGWLSKKHFQVRGGERIPISVSCGVAVFPEDGQKRHELLAVADANLYESRSLGGKIVGRPESQKEKAELRKLGTFGMLESLVTSVDNKDHYTKAHSENVTEYAVMLAQELGHSEQVQKTLRIAGLVHDAGKICIPDRVLRKPGPLTPGEYEVVKHHVAMAEHLLVDLPNLDQVRDAALNHHERFDGTGYPKALKGDQIPLLGRIMAVADAFSAMILDRPYRKGRIIGEALAELERCAGTQLDPELVKAFARVVERREAVAVLNKAW